MALERDASVLCGLDEGKKLEKSDPVLRWKHKKESFVRENGKVRVIGVKRKKRRTECGKDEWPLIEASDRKIG